MMDVKQVRGTNAQKEHAGLTGNKIIGSTQKEQNAQRLALTC